MNVTSVSQGISGQAYQDRNHGTHSTPMTLSGIVGTATPPAHAFHIIILHIHQHSHHANYTDDIELRICMTFSMQYENIAVELIELYVKS